jgi:hypothetical protein
LSEGTPFPRGPSIKGVDVWGLIDERRLSPNSNQKGGHAKTAEAGRREEALDKVISVIQEEIWTSIMNLEMLIRA